MKDDALIEVKGISKHFENTKAVHDISFSIERGEIFALLGPSGCGKTTTLRLIAGFESPTEGEILIDGARVAGRGVFISPEKRKVGMVFQDYALFPHLTVEKNIRFGLKDVTREKRSAVVETMLRFVGLEIYGDRFPSQLSGGQQQRVALARAMAPCPVVVLLDEPLSNLDADMRNKMREDILKMLRDAKTTAILVTHDQEEAFLLADRVAVLNKGRIEQIGSPEEIYHSPATRFVADFVGEADFLRGVVNKGGVDTEIGVFKKELSELKGKEVEVMIRPDDVSFKPNVNGNGEVLDRQFKGEENLYHIGLPSGFVLHSSQPSTYIVDIGSNVEVEANPTHVVVFVGDVAV